MANENPGAYGSGNASSLHGLRRHRGYDEKPMNAAPWRIDQREFAAQRLAPGLHLASLIRFH